MVLSPSKGESLASDGSDWVFAYFSRAFCLFTSSIMFLTTFLQHLPFRAATEDQQSRDTQHPMSTSGPSSGMGSSSSKSISESIAGDANMEQDGQIVQSVRDLRSLASQFHTNCRDPLCNRTIPIHEDPERIEAWRAGARSIPPTTHLSAWKCVCKKSTCVGCNSSPTLNPESFFTPLGVVNHCCEQGRLYAIYFLLCRFDDTQLESAKEPQPKPKARKKTPIKGGKGAATSGIGYASGYDVVAYSGPWGGVGVDDLEDLDFPPDFESYASVVQAHYSSVRTFSEQYMLYISFANFSDDVAKLSCCR